MRSLVRGLRDKRRSEEKTGQEMVDLIAEIQEMIAQRARMKDENARCTKLVMDRDEEGYRFSYWVYHPKRDDGLYDALSVTTRRADSPNVVEYMTMTADELDEALRDALTHHEAGPCPPP